MVMKPMLAAFGTALDELPPLQLLCLRHQLIAKASGVATALVGENLKSQ